MKSPVCRNAAGLCYFCPFICTCNLLSCLSNPKFIAMKNEILNYFKTDRSFEGATKLYVKYGKNLSIKKRMNMEGDTPFFIGVLHEELRKMIDINLKDFQLMMSLKLQPAPKKVRTGRDLSNKQQPTSNEELEPSNQKPEIPEFIKKTIRLREHFPFLKQDDCPKELKILVADMINDFEKFRESHEKLFEASTPEQILEACKDVVEPYLDNRQIWEELEHYKKEGKILGEHPIFDMKEIFEELKELDGKKLAKRKETLENGIRKDKNLIEENDRPDLLDQRKRALERKQLELVEVNRLLEKK